MILERLLTGTSGAPKIIDVGLEVLERASLGSVRDASCRISPSVRSTRAHYAVTTAVVVMGVSGSGKSTLARALAQALSWQFIEGDELHPAANIAKMAAGIALNDEDRQPFLANVARAITAERNVGVVVSCSALKQ